MNNEMVKGAACEPRIAIGTEIYERIRMMADRIENIAVECSEKTNPICSLPMTTDESPDNGRPPQKEYPPLFTAFRDELNRIERSMNSIEDTLSRVEV